ncbi:MAG: hypothetical protein HY906_24755 [Deltaproteobacteria bacterium]|nr:hypothetical protein [Deltaproteobacteria bacterium]
MRRLALALLVTVALLAGCGGRSVPGDPHDGGHPGDGPRDGFTPQDVGPWPYDAWWPYDAPRPWDAPRPYDAPWPYDAWHPYDAPWQYDAWHPYDAPWPYDAGGPDAQLVWCAHGGPDQAWCVVDVAKCCVRGSAATMQCLLSYQSPAGCDLVAWCDGPEDCHGGYACCGPSGAIAEVACRPAPCASGQRLCHVDAHCGAGQRCCTSFAFGWEHRVCTAGSICPP